ncbi:hypothetical protein KR059_001605, partial [Drosophila kikkawai]
KPQFKFPMHNVHFNKTMGIVKNACLFSVLAPTIMYMLYNAPHQRKYRSFYSTYDPIDAFDRMMNGGYIDSFPPGSGPKAKKDKKDKKKK